MTDYKRCPKCGEWGWLDRHTCPPKWDVETIDEETRAAYAYDAEDALVSVAESLWADDYWEELEVRVKRVGEEHWTYYTLTAEPSADFSAKADDSPDLARWES